MGGRGSLSPRVHKVYDIPSLARTLKANGLNLYGAKKINNKNLSLVSEVVETVTKLNKQYGNLVQNIVLGDKSNADFKFSANYKLKGKSGKVIKTAPNTLVITQNTLNDGKAGMNKLIKKVNRSSKKSHGNNYVAAQNVKQMVYHEYGHAMHQALKKHDPAMYNDLNNRVKSLVKNPKKRVNVSVYSKNKKYDGVNTVHEYVAESAVHIIRRTNTNKGRDLVEMTRNYLMTVPSINSGMKLNYKQNIVASGRPKKKKSKTHNKD